MYSKKISYFSKQFSIIVVATLLAVSLFLTPVTLAQNGKDGKGSKQGQQEKKDEEDGVTIEEYYRTNNINFFGRDKTIGSPGDDGGDDDDGGETGGGECSGSSGGDNNEVAFNFFIDNGLTEDQSAGIGGNLVQESGDPINPKANQPGGPGRGIAQWSEGERWETLVAYAEEQNKDPEDLCLQLDFLWYEFETTESAAFSAIKNTSDLRGAVEAFAYEFERCGVCEIETRVGYAEQWLTRYGGG